LGAVPVKTLPAMCIGDGKSANWYTHATTNLDCNTPKRTSGSLKNHWKQFFAQAAVPFASCRCCVLSLQQIEKGCAPPGGRGRGFSLELQVSLSGWIKSGPSNTFWSVPFTNSVPSQMHTGSTSCLGLRLRPTRARPVPLCRVSRKQWP
jgi:hypothetical protein